MIGKYTETMLFDDWSVHRNYVIWWLVSTQGLCYLMIGEYTGTMLFDDWWVNRGLCYLMIGE